MPVPRLVNVPAPPIVLAIVVSSASPNVNPAPSVSVVPLAPFSRPMVSAVLTCSVPAVQIDHAGIDQRRTA